MASKLDQLRDLTAALSKRNGIQDTAFSPLKIIQATENERSEQGMQLGDRFERIGIQDIPRFDSLVHWIWVCQLCDSHHRDSLENHSVNSLWLANPTTAVASAVTPLGMRK